RDAGKSVARLLVNSTVGVGGLFNVAPKDLADADRDFDQTLASWGIPPGIYLMLPLGGPSSVRDAIASFGESFLDPVNYIRGEDADAIIAGAHGVKTVNDFSFRIEEVDSLMKSTVDPYAAVKAYYEERLPNDAVDRTR
ncbi:MAG: MlaA family lipoprotein, partial [Candidatus Hydrogenedentota bacterium]